MDRTAVQRAMWDRLEAEKNELKAEFGGRVDRLYETIKLEVEHVYGNVQDDIVPVVPHSPSPLTTPNESRLNSIHHQDNVDNLIITPPPAANSTDHITHRTTEHNSTRSELLTVNLIEGGQNVDEEQSSSPLAVDVTSQPSSIHHHHDIRVIQSETVPFDSSSNMPNSSDHHPQPDNSQQPNSVSNSSLTDQNGTTGMQQQQIKQELSDEDETNDRSEQSNDDGDGDFVKDEYFSECEDDSDCVVPEIKGEFDYGQEVEIRQEEDEEEDTTDNEEMMDEEEEEEEEEEDDDKTQIDDIEGLAQDNQIGGDSNDESRSVDNAPMDTTAARQIGQSHNVQNASNESIEEGCANLSSEQLPSTANQSDDPTMTQSGGDLLAPSTSTGRRSNRAALNQQANASTGRNATKRKQPTSNRSTKRSKQTIEEEDDSEGGEDIANEGREEAKVKVLYLNCTVANCTAKLDSLVHLHDHLSTEHQLASHQCFATNCNARFDNSKHMHDHIKLYHPQDTRFLCAVCPKEFDSQRKAYDHWYQNHQTGQFQCNFVSDCTEVTETRRKMRTHQRVKHSKHLHCSHPGCTASFGSIGGLRKHERIHLASRPFHCTFQQCSHSTKLRGQLIQHIRTKHFGLPVTVKKQKERNIVDERDPNEYVRVVVDE